jgi:hypothetical protein
MIRGKTSSSCQKTSSKPGGSSTRSSTSTSSPHCRHHWVTTQCVIGQEYQQVTRCVSLGFEFGIATCCWNTWHGRCRALVLCLARFVCKPCNYYYQPRAFIKQHFVTSSLTSTGMDWELGERHSPVVTSDALQAWQVHEGMAF